MIDYRKEQQLRYFEKEFRDNGVRLNESGKLNHLNALIIDFCLFVISWLHDNG